MTTVSAALQNIGGVLGLVGVVWMLWDFDAYGPGWWLGCSLVFLAAGGATQ
jgi:hypothetical protein